MIRDFLRSLFAERPVRRFALIWGLIIVLLPGAWLVVNWDDLYPVGRAFFLTSVAVMYAVSWLVHTWMFSILRRWWLRRQSGGPTGAGS